MKRPAEKSQIRCWGIDFMLPYQSQMHVCNMENGCRIPRIGRRKR